MNTPRIHLVPGSRCSRSCQYWKISIFGSLIGDVMISRSRSSASTVAIDIGNVAIDIGVLGKQRSTDEHRHPADNVFLGHFGLDRSLRQLVGMPGPDG